MKFFISFLVVSFSFCSFANKDCENVFNENNQTENNQKTTNKQNAVLQELLDLAHRHGFEKLTVEEAKIVTDWYESSAEGGSVEAQFNFGFLHEHALGGFKRDYEKAAKWYGFAAEQEHPIALYRLGRLFKKGLGVEENPEKAVELYKRSSDLGYARAKSRLATMHEHGLGGLQKDPETAYRLHIEAAEQGDMLSQAQVGFMYENNLGGLPRDLKKAYEWYEKSAEQGHPQAQSRLAYMKEKALGTKEDLEGAGRLYLQAAKAGYDKAQFQMGFIREKGLLGFDKDLEKSFKWYLQAAEQGHDKAQNQVAFMLERGIGVTENLADSIHWHKLAAKSGNAESLYRLAYLHNTDLVVEGQVLVEKDPDHSVFLYIKSALKGNRKAEFQIAFLHEEGKSDLVEQDSNRAIFWYERSAEQGYDKAQFNLAFMLEKGKGIADPDPEGAVKWYYMAAMQNHAVAQFLLAKMQEKGEVTFELYLEVLHFHAESVKTESVKKKREGLSLQETLKIKEVEESYALYKKLEEQGDLGPALDLERDFFLKESFKWHEKSANQGYVPAQNQVAFMLEKGKGIADPDPKEAVKWYYMAAMQNHTAAQFRLAKMQEKGKVTFELYLEVLNFHAKSVKKKRGGLGLQETLEKITEVEESYALYKKLEEQGDGGLALDLERDFFLKESFKWYYKSAKLGYVKAQIQAAYMLENQIGVDEDLRGARTLYEMAAKKGDGLALYRLAVMQGEGLAGFDPSPDTALELYKQSAQKGYSKARKKLNSLARKNRQNEADEQNRENGDVHEASH